MGPKENFAPASFAGADGVVTITLTLKVSICEPPRLCGLRWLSQLFFAAQPPLLTQEGRPQSERLCIPKHSKNQTL
jgi:hypothetical protein